MCDTKGSSVFDKMLPVDDNGRSRVGDDLALNTGWVAFQGSGLAIFKETYRAL